MEHPKFLETVIWNDSTKKWELEIINVEEYHGFTECRHCKRPFSHNVKTNGAFKIVYVKCACKR